jgi:hypothetical protein
MNPRIKSVKPLEDYQLLLKFTNGEQGVYDCKPLLNLGVFKELQNRAYFKQAVVLDGTVSWPHEQDICPDTLYLDTVKIDLNQHIELMRSLSAKTQQAWDSNG